MSSWKEWGVLWRSPLGEHVASEPTRDAAYQMVRTKKLQANCTSEVVCRDVTVTEWRTPGSVGAQQ